MAKEKRPVYFRLFIEACNMLSILPVESAGKVIHAASWYFDDHVEPEGLDRSERIVFDRIRKDIDQSFEDYRQSVETGKLGSQKRWRKDD